jgi:hypothetical protein
LQQYRKVGQSLSFFQSGKYKSESQASELAAVIGITRTLALPWGDDLEVCLAAHIIGLGEAPWE